MKRTLLISALVLSALAQAQDTVRYVGSTLSNVDYHHGQLQPVVGVHNIQVFRADRSNPERSGDSGWTYNHAPMICYWNDRFFVQYLSNPVGEHEPPGQTLLLSSQDGRNWTRPVVVFPPVKIPDGTTKEGRSEVAKDLGTVQHQRMGFFVSSKGRLLTLAFHGVVLGKGDDPNDGRGMGRVVREIRKDGSFGPIYFIRVNKAWQGKQLPYALYTTSKDKGFVAACNELLAEPLMMQQWVEEADRDDPLIPLHKDYKAFSYYHLNDGRVVGLWKNALTSISNDGGRTWMYSPLRAPRFVNSNAKIWGQKTGDGRFATVYNPSEFRWPLAISTSRDGLNYENLWLVNGEISSMRYGGAYKSYGPQYVRGIEEGNGQPADGKLWVTYSMNKEDIWVSSIPVPVTEVVTGPVNEEFNQLPAGKELEQWNYNSGLWTPVGIDKTGEGLRALHLQDWDPFDYAKAERVLPSAKRMVVAFSLIAEQDGHGWLDIEFLDKKGIAGARFSLDSAGGFLAKAGYRNRNLMKYVKGQRYDVRIELNAETRFYQISVNGKSMPAGLFFQPLASIDRIAFRTGHARRFPDADTPTDQNYDLPAAESKATRAGYYILNFKAEPK